VSITFKLKPRFVSGFDFMGRARSQWSVLQVISSGGDYLRCYGTTHTDCFRLDSKPFVRVYSLEKRRKKVKVLDKPVKWTKKKLKDNGFLLTDEKYTYREIIHPTHWVGVYYDIPIEMLRLMSLKAVQKKHNFVLEKMLVKDFKAE
jgi:hypothetical protein